MKTKYLTFSKRIIILMLLVVSGFLILILNRRQALGRELILIPPVQSEPSFYIGEDGMRLCECGCGREVAKEGNRFIQGHYWKGKHHTKGTKEKMGKTLKEGYASGRLIILEERKKKISIAKKGKPSSMKGKPSSMKGEKHKQESKDKMSIAKKGNKYGAGNKDRIVSKKTRKLLSKKAKGNKNGEGNKGKKCSEEKKDKIRKSLILYMQSNNYSFKPTSIEVAFENELKKTMLNYQKQFYVENVGIVDFFLFDYGIIVECDGDFWHNLPGAKQKDFDKNFAAFFLYGYKTLRFWEYEINKSLEKCIGRLLEEIDLTLLRKVV